MAGGGIDFGPYVNPVRPQVQPQQPRMQEPQRPQGGGMQGGRFPQQNYGKPGNPFLAMHQGNVFGGPQKPFNPTYMDNFGGPRPVYAPFENTGGPGAPPPYNPNAGIEPVQVQPNTYNPQLEAFKQMYQGQPQGLMPLGIAGLMR